MNGALKLAVAALTVTVLYSAVRSWLPAWAPLVALCGAGAVLAVLAGDEAAWLQGLTGLQQAAGTEAFQCLFKSVGIILVADYSRDLCRDAGLSSVAVCIEFCGRCLVLLAAWPVFSGVLESVQRLQA